MATAPHDFLSVTNYPSEGVVFYDGVASPIGSLLQNDSLAPIPDREEHPGLQLLDDDPMTPIVFYGELTL